MLENQKRNPPHGLKGPQATSSNAPLGKFQFILRGRVSEPRGFTDPHTKCSQCKPSLTGINWPPPC